MRCHIFAFTTFTDRLPLTSLRDGALDQYSYLRVQRRRFLQLSRSFFTSFCDINLVTVSTNVSILNDIPATKDAAKHKKEVEDSGKGNSVEVVDTSKLTEQQKYSVLRNWATLSRDVQGRGKRVFLEIFRRNPELKRFFTFSNLTDEEIVNVRIRHCIVGLILLTYALIFYNRDR